VAFYCKVKTLIFHYDFAYYCRSSWAMAMAMAIAIAIAMAMAMAMAKSK
jgi:hypothetical protein